MQSKVYLLSTQVSNQSSHLIVTAEFTPFWGHLQLDHPINVKISNVTLIFKYLLESKVIIFLIRVNSAPEIVNSIGEIERKFLKHYTLNETLLWMLVATAMKTSVKQQ